MKVLLNRLENNKVIYSNILDWGLGTFKKEISPNKSTI